MSMKYKHQGYRDSERQDEGRSPRKPAADRPALSEGERAQQRSLRHALDRGANEVIRCPSCGQSVAHFGSVTIETRCPHCAAALHACRACRHFDTSARWECRLADRIPARVPDKAAANTCPLYEPRLVLDATGKRTAPGTRGGNDPKSQFENLFKR